MDGSLFTLTEEHRMIRETARDFARNAIVPIAAQFDESGEFPRETVQKMGHMGFMGIEVPEAYGGAGLDTLAYVLAVEEISKADASHGVIMSVNNSLYCHGILKYGTEQQKNRVSGARSIRQGDRSLRADRADVRLRCRKHEQPGRSRRGVLCSERPQVVGYQRAGGRLCPDIS